MFQKSMHVLYYIILYYIIIYYIIYIYIYIIYIIYNYILYIIYNYILYIIYTIWTWKHVTVQSLLAPSGGVDGGRWLTPTWGVIDSLRSDSVSGWLIPSALPLILKMFHVFPFSLCLAVPYSRWTQDLRRSQQLTSMIVSPVQPLESFSQRQILDHFTAKWQERPRSVNLPLARHSNLILRSWDSGTYNWSADWPKY